MLQMKARLFYFIPLESCEWCDHFCNISSLFHANDLKWIVWTQLNLIFEQSSVDFMLISYCIIKWIANFIGSTPIHGRVGGVKKKKTWRTTGRQESWIRFWPIRLLDSIHSAIWADWYTRRYKYMKIFQDCAKLKSAFALTWFWPIPCPPTHYLRGIVLWRLYRKTMSLYRMCAREMASFGFFQFLSHSIRDDLISNKWAPQLSKSTLY